MTKELRLRTLRTALFALPFLALAGRAALATASAAQAPALTLTTDVGTGEYRIATQNAPDPVLRASTLR